MDSVVVKCRCLYGDCTSRNCACKKNGSMCHDECHKGKPWASVPCLNTVVGLKVKEMKIGQVKRDLIEAEIDVIGDNIELRKLLAVHNASQQAGLPREVRHPLWQLELAERTRQVRRRCCSGSWP